MATTLLAAFAGFSFGFSLCAWVSYRAGPAPISIVFLSGGTGIMACAAAAILALVPA